MAYPTSANSSVAGRGSMLTARCGSLLRPCCITPPTTTGVRQSRGIQDAKDELAAGMTAEESLQRNKQNVQAFYELMFNQARPTEAIRKYAGRPTASTTLTLVAGSRLHRLLRTDGGGVSGKRVEQAGAGRSRLRRAALPPNL